MVQSHSPPHHSQWKKSINNLDAEEVALPSDRGVTGFASLVARQ